MLYGILSYRLEDYFFFVIMGLHCADQRESGLGTRSGVGSEASGVRRQARSVPGLCERRADVTPRMRPEGLLDAQGTLQLQIKLQYYIYLLFRKNKAK